jgi:prepilin signal peptidase PulO-like enzyme (type II secretory pathway)
MTMVLLYALAGLLMGSFLKWAGDYLPRLASSAAPSSEYTPRPIPPLFWRSSIRLKESFWLGVAVEISTALLFAYLWERFGLSWRFLILAFNCSFLLLVAIVDLKYRLVLNVLIYPAAVVTLFLRSIPPGRDTIISLLGGVVGLSLFSLAALVRRGGMGAGDVKLAALIGLMVGFPRVLWALALGVLAGGVTSVLLFLFRLRGLKSYIPYAPFLCSGAIIALVFL